MHPILILGAVALAAVLLWWGGIDADAGELERRSLMGRATRRRDRRRARTGAPDPAARFGPRRRRDASGTGLVAREGDPAGALLDADGWRRRRDGLQRVHGRL